MTHYEMAEKLSEKLGVTLEEATEALEACDWEMLDAALMLEKAHGGARQEAYSTRSAVDDAEAEGSRTVQGHRGVIRGLGGVIRGIFNMGNRNQFQVHKNDEIVLEMPVMVLALLLLLAFWVVLPLLVVGLFANYRYTFSGAELGRASVNNAMEKAAEVAEKVKEEVTGDH